MGDDTQKAGMSSTQALVLTAILVALLLGGLLAFRAHEQQADENQIHNLNEQFCADNGFEDC